MAFFESIKRYFASISPQYRGAVYIVIGLLIMLDSLNILSKSIHIFVFLAAVGLMVYGVQLTNVLDLISKKK